MSTVCSDNARERARAGLGGEKWRKSEREGERERERDQFLVGVGNEVGGMCENGGESRAGDQAGVYVVSAPATGRVCGYV